LAKNNYQFEKRKRDLAKKKKREEKQQRKLEKKGVDPDRDPNETPDGTAHE
jgi:hypothetical protein